MTKTNTIHIEPLDEGYVVTHDGKRKAMTYDELKGLLDLIAFQMFSEFIKKKSNSLLTFTLEADIPRVA